MQPVELINLVHAKRVGGDVQWLRGELGIQMANLSDTIKARLLNWLRLTSGYHTLESFSLGAPEKQRVQTFAFLLCILLRKDYDKFAYGSSDESEHSQMMAKLDEILKHPELAAKIHIEIHTHEKNPNC